MPPLTIYLVRHAKAERPTPAARDEDRLLTTRGHRQAAWLAQALAHSDAPPALVLTSPAPRALATAQAIAAALNTQARIELALSLDSNAQRVVALIASLDQTSPVALVGHNPTLTLVLDHLTGARAQRDATELRTGQAARLDPYPPASPRRYILASLLRLDDDA